MSKNRRLRPRPVERECSERLKLIFDWLSRQYAYSDQTFRDLVSVLDRFCHMQTRSLPKEDLELLERTKPDCNWLSFQAELRHEIQIRLTAIKYYSARSGAEKYPVPPKVRELWGKLRRYGDYESFKAPQRLLPKRGEDGELYFECEVRLFPLDGTKLQKTHLDEIPKNVHQYLLHMIFGDLVGMRQSAIGCCFECGKFYVNRRRILRRFCSATCRWRYAARAGVAPQKTAGKKRHRVAAPKPSTPEAAAIALFDELGRLEERKPN